MRQKLNDLRQQLERWRSHNEVHAKPADKILYDFLSELLKLAEHDEKPESEPVEEVPVDVPVEPEVSEATTASAEGGEGGNSPDQPPVLP